MTPEERVKAATEAHSKFSLVPMAPEIDAAYTVVEAMIPAADGSIGGGPYWFGWALREAYLRGVLAERERCAAVATAMAEHHRDHCPRECRCADGWHIAERMRTGEQP